MAAPDQSAIGNVLPAHPRGTECGYGRLERMAHAGLGTILTTIGVATARPIAILVVPLYAVGWAYFEPATFDWHAIAVLAAWAMTFLIQRAAHRDTQAIHAKIDELLREDPAARSELEHMDDEEPEDIERHRERERS
jgi:low affinity Fe/Cu permease